MRILATGLFLCLVSVGAANTSALASDVARQDGPVIVRYEARWDVQQSGVTDDLYDVFFASALVGWAVGRNNTVIKTTDGGETWRRLMDRRENGTWFREVAFANENQGWAQANDVLLYTSNGGETWQPAAPSPNPQDSNWGPGAVVGPTRFQIAGLPGTQRRLLRTDDGGRSWTVVNDSLPHNDYERMFFADLSNGWIARGTQLGTLLMTTDGGRSWQELPQKMFRAPDLAFVTPTTGWAFADDPGTVVFTSDGGRTWERQSTGIRTSLADLEFFDAGVGHVLCNCERGIVIRTVDGGWTWSEIGRLGAPDHLRALHFPDPEHGWVVGEKGFIIHYHLIPIYEEMAPGAGEEM